MPLTQIHHTSHAGTETFAALATSGGIALLSTHHSGTASRTIDIPDAVAPWLIATLTRRLEAELASKATVSARISAIAGNPALASPASLAPIAAMVERMERALDEQVANAFADWRAAEGARFLRRGRFDLVMGGRA